MLRSAGFSTVASIRYVFDLRAASPRNKSSLFIFSVAQLKPQLLVLFDPSNAEFQYEFNFG